MMKLTTVVACLTAVVPAIRAQTPSLRRAQATDPTIADIACSNDSFTTLCAALQAAGLTGTLSDRNAKFTVFAPNDAAFAALGQPAIDALLADLDALSNILLYHVLPNLEIESSDIPHGRWQTVVTMANGEKVRLINNSAGVFVKVRASVEKKDLPLCCGHKEPRSMSFSRTLSSPNLSLFIKILL